MNTQKQNKDLGTIGETFVLERLTSKGFSLYKRNMRQWGFEIDLILYRYNEVTQYLEIRIIEVKTRMSDTGTYLGVLDNYGIEGKWKRIRGRMFSFRNAIVEEKGIEVFGSSSHFDLAIVFLNSNSSQHTLRMHTYIKDVNLFI